MPSLLVALLQNRQEMKTKQTTEKEERRHNITYLKAGVSCFLGSSLVKIPACV
jgi:hypothetical protein